MKAIDRIRAHNREFTRLVLAELLAQLTQPQRDMFSRMYPNGPSEKQLANALDQIERTIKKNVSKSDHVSG